MIQKEKEIQRKAVCSQAALLKIFLELLTLPSHNISHFFTVQSSILKSFL